MSQFPRFRRVEVPKLFDARRRGENARDKARRAGGKSDEHADRRWRELSEAFRRKNPYCRFSEQAGRTIVLAEGVDHIIPIWFAPDLKYVWENLQSLSNSMHYGPKAKLERICERLGMMESLPLYCGSLVERVKLLQRY